MSELLHLAGPDGRGSDCGVSFARAPRTTFVAADVTCPECRTSMELRRRCLVAAAPSTEIGRKS